MNQNLSLYHNRLGLMRLTLTFEPTEPVEYFSPIAEKGPKKNRYQQAMGMVKKHVLAEAGSSSSKAAALLTRGAYFRYVSTAKRRERRWRLFSTFPYFTTAKPGIAQYLESLLSCLSLLLP